MIYYWAFGSNLNVRAMRVRCPAATRVEPLTVVDGKLVFRGVADVVHCPGRSIPGGVWRITKACERALDRYEGVDSKLYLKRYFTAEVDGQERRVLYYQMAAHRGVQPPSESYLRTIAEGYEDFGLDIKELDRAVAESWNDKDITPMLKRRHEKRGSPQLARRRIAL